MPPVPFRLPLALVLMAGLAGGAQAQMALSCEGGGGHLGAAVVCDPLRQLLAGRAGPPVRLVVTRDEAQVLAAHLVWQGRNGPTVEVTAADRPLDARAGARLARGLVAVSNLPE
ncbi:MAG: hypothetical protein WCZ72_04465 [Gemmobacter sp.]